MALDNFPKLVAQYGLFMDRGLKWGSLNSYYGAYSLASAFWDEARGREVVERVIDYNKANSGLADRLKSTLAQEGIASIFKAAGRYENFMKLAQEGTLPTEQPSSVKEKMFLYRGIATLTAAVILAVIGITLTRNPPTVPYPSEPPKPVAAYTDSSTKKSLALKAAGWVYDKNGHFKRIVEDGDNRGVSGIVVDAYRKLSSKTQMDAERAALLADEIIHTEGSQVKRKGKKGNMGDLRNPKKNIIKEDDILRAHVSVLSQLFN